MSAPTALIAEDEPVLRAELKEALAALWPELAIRAEAVDGIQAMRALAEHSPESLFRRVEKLDVSETYVHLFRQM